MLLQDWIYFIVLFFFSDIQSTIFFFLLVLILILGIRLVPSLGATFNEGESPKNKFVPFISCTVVAIKKVVLSWASLSLSFEVTMKKNAACHGTEKPESAMSSFLKTLPWWKTYQPLFLLKMFHKMSV